MDPLPFDARIIRYANSSAIIVPAQQLKSGRVRKDWEYEVRLIPVRKIQKENPETAREKGPKPSAVRRASPQVLTFDDDGLLIAVERRSR